MIGIDVDEVRDAVVSVAAGGGTVVGVGLDVVDVAAFAEQLDVPGSTFLTTAFTAGERSDVVDVRDGGRHVDARRLAARFAAKEAFVKAWSNCSFGRPPRLDHWRPAQVEVVQDAWGRSRLRLHGELAGAVAAHFGDGWSVHLSSSHDGPVAAALVVLASGTVEVGR